MHAQTQTHTQTGKGKRRIEKWGNGGGKLCCKNNIIVHMCYNMKLCAQSEQQEGVGDTATEVESIEVADE